MAKRRVEIPDGEFCGECKFLTQCGSYMACALDAEILTVLKGGEVMKSADCMDKG
jgi:hypothetical protein